MNPTSLGAAMRELMRFPDWQNELERLCEESALSFEEWPPEDEDREFHEQGFSPAERLSAWLGRGFEAGGDDCRRAFMVKGSPLASSKTGNATGAMGIPGYFHRLTGNRIKAGPSLVQCVSGPLSVFGPTGVALLGTVSTALFVFVTVSALVAAAFTINPLAGVLVATVIGSPAICAVILSGLSRDRSPWRALPDVRPNHARSPQPISWD